MAGDEKDLFSGTEEESKEKGIKKEFPTLSDLMFKNPDLIRNDKKKKHFEREKRKMNDGNNPLTTD